MVVFLVTSGLVAGYLADSQRFSALLLVAEPFLDLACVLMAYACWSGQHRPLGVSFLFGILGNFAAVRVPWPAPPPAEAPALLPGWLQQVQNCLPSVGWPQDGLRILQWTAEGDLQMEEVVEVLVALRPDLFLLSGTDSLDLAVRLNSELGGEYEIQPSEGAFPGRVLLARGAFHICGDSSRWSLQTSTFGFAGITPDTIVPLLVSWHEGPFDSRPWQQQRDRWGEEELLLEHLQSPATILAVDAPALPTWRYLQAGLREVGLTNVATPPNWPVRLLQMPMLPLHPYDRLWVGPGWNISASQRVKVRSGRRAPVLTTLEPASNTAQNLPAQRPRLTR